MSFRHILLGSSLSFGLLLAACGDDADDPGSDPKPEAGEDAGTPRDAGTALDASGSIDAGGSLDATSMPLDAIAPVDAAPVDASPPADPSTALDLLFVIDNSGSMASEQLKVTEQLPMLVRALTRGDRSLHLGVVSTNAGGIDDFPANAQEAILSCQGQGDDGRILNSTRVAVDGVVALNRNEFVGYDAGQVVLPARAECDLPNLPRYQQYTPGDSAADLAAAFACVSALGVRGCPFEQPLESMWKALAPSTPSDALHTFINGGKGQGDRYNEGFLREGAKLAVVIVTDEEDCSITDAGKALFRLDEEANDLWGNLNLRCFEQAGDATLVQPVQRFVEGLASLKPGHPERIVLGAIVGVPEEAIASGTMIDDILQLPEMQYAENPLNPGIPQPSCVSTNGFDEAYPARRMLELARDLPGDAVLGSICESSYERVFSKLIDAILSP